MNIDVKPRIVCLCGSTRFKSQFEMMNRKLTLTGAIVLSPGWFKGDPGSCITSDCKKDLDELLKRKIDLADEILVINVGGYVSDSTKSEIEYAKRRGKTVTYLEQKPTYDEMAKLLVVIEGQGWIPVGAALADQLVDVVRRL
jgi:hypothetical protein